MRKTFLPFLGLLGAYSVYMNETTEGGESGGAGAPESNDAPATDPNAVRIRPDLTGYAKSKSASGSTTKICGDVTSVALAGAELDETYAFVAKVTGVGEDVLRAKYSGSNVGQQRMFLGNLIRPAMADAKSPMKDADKAKRIRDAFEAGLPEFRKAIDARLETAAKAAQAEKDRKAQEKADEKAKKDAAKADAAAAKAKDPKASEQGAAKPAAERPAAPKAPAQPK